MPDDGLHLQPGTASAPTINPHLRRRRSVSADPDALAEALLTGDRTALSRAITLVESTRPEHRQAAGQLLETIAPHTDESLRIGVTGSPGVGKSTFIEAFGTHLVEQGRRLAVLAVDPSSSRTGGSILGDKTRMNRLAQHEQAYVRPSPSGRSLGGVARATREALLLCEAAGFDTVLIETVGVGQAETRVYHMTDVFLLLALAGAGDELQGIKRGIVEMADLLAITKADGENVEAAKRARRQLKTALNLLPRPHDASVPQVLTCSALAGTGIAEVWNAVADFAEAARLSGRFEARRREQATQALRQAVEDLLLKRLYADEQVQQHREVLEQQVALGKLPPTLAAQRLVDLFGR